MWNITKIRQPQNSSVTVQYKYVSVYVFIHVFLHYEAIIKKIPWFSNLSEKILTTVTVTCAKTTTVVIIIYMCLVTDFTSTNILKQLYLRTKELLQKTMIYKPEVTKLMIILNQVQTRHGICPETYYFSRCILENKK